MVVWDKARKNPKPSWGRKEKAKKNYKDDQNKIIGIEFTNFNFIQYRYTLIFIKIKP